MQRFFESVLIFCILLVIECKATCVNDNGDSVAEGDKAQRGIFCWQCTPNGVWQNVGNLRSCESMLEVQKRVKRAPFQFFPNGPPMPMPGPMFRPNPPFGLGQPSQYPFQSPFQPPVYQPPEYIDHTQYRPPQYPSIHGPDYGGGNPNEEYEEY